MLGAGPVQPPHVALHFFLVFLHFFFFAMGQVVVLLEGSLHKPLASFRAHLFTPHLSPQLDEDATPMHVSTRSAARAERTIEARGSGNGRGAKSCSARAISLFCAPLA